jgi:hypothetical protein
LLLSEIVAILTGRRVENLNMNPTSTAACLFNIRKALEILKSNKVTIKS